MTIQNTYKEAWEVLQAVCDITDPANPRLRTDAVLETGDIEIGAVEIKNATDDTRVKVGSDGTQNALYVQAAKIDLATTSLRDAITGAGAAAKTLADVVSAFPASPATSTKQSDGSQKSQVVDGSGNVIGATGNALDINIKSGNPANPSTSTKQSDGSQKTQIVDGSGNVIGATSNALDINVKTGNITGFALETGGNLEKIAGQACTPLSGQATASGDTTIVPLTALKKIRIYRIYLQNVNSTAVAVYLKLTIGSSAVNVCPATLVQYQMLTDNVRAGQKYYECDVATAVVLNLGGVSNVNWQIDYTLV